MSKFYRKIVPTQKLKPTVLPCIPKFSKIEFIDPIEQFPSSNTNCGLEDSDIRSDELGTQLEQEYVVIRLDDIDVIPSVQHIDKPETLLVPDSTPEFVENKGLIPSIEITIPDEPDSLDIFGVPMTTMIWELPPYKQ